MTTGNLVETRERGTSMVEALAALAILAMTLVFVLSSISVFTRMNRNSEIRANATSAARSRLEELRFEDPQLLPNTGYVTTPALVGPHEFTVVTHYCLDNSACDDTTRHITIDVQDGGQSVFDAETIITQLR